MTHLYLIRHGESMSAVQQRVADHVGEAGLSPFGVRQAGRLRDRLAATREIVADVLIASTMPRARQTAEIIAPALGLPLLLDPEVEEVRNGEADGLLFEEVAARFGKPQFSHDPYRPVAPGGESWSAFLHRAGSAFHRITHDHAGKRIVIVCHGGIVDGSFLYFLGLTSLTRVGVSLYTHNTSITHWEQVERESRPLWRLVKYNDDLHLRDGIRWEGVGATPIVGADAPAVPLPTEPRTSDGR